MLSASFEVSHIGCPHKRQRYISKKQVIALVQQFLSAVELQVKNLHSSLPVFSCCKRNVENASDAGHFLWSDFSYGISKNKNQNILIGLFRKLKQFFGWSTAIHDHTKKWTIYTKPAQIIGQGKFSGIYKASEDTCNKWAFSQTVQWNLFNLETRDINPMTWLT